MSKVFHSHIQAALKDGALSSALDANAERRREVRQQAFNTLPDIMNLRKQAHSVRAETLANLDGYLDQFVTQATRNGIIVHHAATATQAAEIVLGVAKDNGARMVAKSKSMVSEEIGLNHKLEAAGIRAIETDLGEYIVQLRGEKPSHIITPAVHLNRKQVGQTFHEKLGIPLTEDIDELTTIARRTLREIFFASQIGISGVNFGVAETGTLCIVTNEGNGRMVTTLPPVHIALMGIERLVPTMDDLALMLALLPRSATGQKITVYVNLMNSPRRQLDQDGPRQRHLVLVDNGRTAMRASPLAEALLCIRCGACLNACPIFREIGGHAYVNLHGESTIYPGPIGSIVSPGLLGQANYGHLARASTLCGACQEACPVDINLPKLLLRTRAGGLKIDHQPAQGPRALAIGLRLYAWLATDPRRFALSQRLAAALTGILSPHKKWVRLPAFTGWGTSRHLLKPAARPFRAQWGQEIASTSGPTLQDTPTRIPPIIDLDTQEVTADKETPFKGPLMDRQALIEQFQSELTALGGTATLCEEKDLAAELLIYLRARQVTSLMSWEAAQLPDGLLTALTDGGIRIISQLQTADPEKTNPRFGLTGALAAIAETGTLALDSGTGRPLETSLVPEVHIAVLHSEAIYQSLTQVLRLRKVREASSVVLISGPSRTADIEMTLTIGVHGPTEVHVFCIK